MQKQDNKFDCGLFPIVQRTQQLETAPILIEDEADFWGDDSELYMDAEVDHTPTAEFYRAEPLQPWSPYMTYPEQRIIEQKRKNREFWMSLLCFIGDAIIITILFTALFLLS